jgi:hypothetical protein
MTENAKRRIFLSRGERRFCIQKLHNEDVGLVRILRKRRTSLPSSDMSTPLFT